MKSVLILTNNQDLHTDLVLRAIRSKGGVVQRFHPDQFPSDCRITYVNGSIIVRDEIHEQTFSIADISSVWCRRPQLCRSPPAITDPAMRRFAVTESQHLIENLYMMLEDAFWVNPYFVNIRARYKLLQRRIAEKVGLTMPKTIVTNDPEAARQFFDDNNGHFVYKSVGTGIVHNEDGSSDLIFTNKMGKEDLQELSQIRLTPCVFQEYIEKDIELRVTIVGKKVFTCAIHSQKQSKTAVDWRRGKSDYEIFDLPKDIKAKLLAFMAEYGLMYGAFDLILTQTGQFVMLELNPNGQWAFVQGFTGLPIADALAELLMRKKQ